MVNKILVIHTYINGEDLFVCGLKTSHSKIFVFSVLIHFIQDTDLHLKFPWSNWPTTFIQYFLLCHCLETIQPVLHVRQ